MVSERRGSLITTVKGRESTDKSADKVPRYYRARQKKRSCSVSLGKQVQTDGRQSVPKGRLLMFAVNC